MVEWPSCALSVFHGELFSLSHSAQSHSSFRFRTLRFSETEGLVIPFLKNKSRKTNYVLSYKSRVWKLGVEITVGQVAVVI